ncbi:MAG TPA: 16S rRNA (guanine(527)-N(7))-methyltransferase RsmG [Candidatus Cybelea sp.]|nr:16S rRNA (guanine(527)-N(7))-methyltransferase RsmG [Candidatus Cybelea sp.]
MTPEERELEALIEETGLDSAVRMRLARYGALVLAANRRLNLTGAKTPAELAEHVRDSLTVIPYVRERYVDVGSGAGFPAIPIALVTGLEVTLIEATAKKAHFLERALEELNLRGCVVAARAESAARDLQLRDAFFSGTIRAVGSASAVAELLLPFIAPGGVAVLQRGSTDDPERAALSDAALVLGGEIESEHPVGDRRCIFLVRKKRATPERFPRRNGIPQKRPLCG